MPTDSTPTSDEQDPAAQADDGGIESPSASEDPDEEGVRLMDLPASIRPQNILLSLAGAYLALWFVPAMAAMWGTRRSPGEMPIMWAFIGFFIVLPAGLVAGALAVRAERAATGRRPLSRFIWLPVSVVLFGGVHMLPMLIQPLVLMVHHWTADRNWDRFFDHMFASVVPWIGVAILLAPTLWVIRRLAVRQITAPVRTAPRPRRVPKIPSSLYLVIFYGIVAWPAFGFAALSSYDWDAIYNVIIMYAAVGAAVSVAGGAIAARTRAEAARQNPGFTWLPPERLHRHWRLEITGHLLTVHFGVMFLSGLFPMDTEPQFILLGIGFVGVLLGLIIGTPAWRDRYLEELSWSPEGSPPAGAEVPTGSGSTATA